MSENDVNQEIQDLIDETNVDLEYVEDNITESEKDLEDALEDASKKLKKNLEKLAKEAKKEIKWDVLNFYHENKAVVKDDLKAMNSYIKDIFSAIKEDLNEEISDTVDKDVKKALKEARSKVKKSSRKYNRRYAMLKIKLAVGNAEVDVKNFFS